MPLREAKVRRLVAALFANLDRWAEQSEEIAENAIPVTGNKSRALHLKASILQAKLTLENLMRDAEKG